MVITIESRLWDEILRGLWAPEGKQPEWAKDYWKSYHEERKRLETEGDRTDVPPHDDNCGSPCRNVGPGTLLHDMFYHDCCYFCSDMAEEHGFLSTEEKSNVDGSFN